MAQIPGSSWTEGQYVAQLTHVRPNYAFERPGSLSSRARVRPFHCSLPSARWKRLRPAAQRER
jgi:hypothetical protein